MNEQQYQAEVMDELKQYHEQIKNNIYGQQILNNQCLLAGCIAQLKAADDFYKLKEIECQEVSVVLESTQQCLEHQKDG